MRKSCVRGLKSGGEGDKKAKGVFTTTIANSKVIPILINFIIVGVDANGTITPGQLQRITKVIAPDLPALERAITEQLSKIG